MINKHNIMWRCPCGRNTNILHEIFYGTSARKISIEYNIQIPLCPVCHTVAHTRELLNGFSPLLACRTKDGLNKVMIQTKLCDKLGINRNKTSLAVNTYDLYYLNNIKNKCLGMIKTFEIN